ncbi:hypothetical protein [Burkholderia territorii]|uniref:hypothetical protein n=1 Tax=Burkholderia territorii TaxID=1503055 RepID=UPI0012D8D289|nr:hypothetical protein [Burkholderia territorii]
MQTLLDACIAAGGPDPQELDALRQVGLAYENAIREMRDSSAEIASHVDALRERKDGWLAYAALSGLEE